MQYKLRDYQIEAVEAGIAALLSPTPRPSMLVLATGSGKAILVSAICERLSKLDPKAGVLILAPSKELLEQDLEKLKAYNIKNIKAYSASVGSKEVGRYTIATIGSIYQKWSLFRHVKYVIVDECDCAAITPDGMYMSFFERLGITRILGLTATPYKLRNKTVKVGRYLENTATICLVNRFPPLKTKEGKKQFAWGKICYKMEMKELQRKRYLVPIKYYSEIPKANLRLNSTGADYNSDDIKEFAHRNSQRIYDVVRACIKRDNPKRVLVFAPSVKASQDVSKALIKAGIKADHVDGKTPKKDRTEKIAKFKSGETQVMCNCQCLTAGFDLPELDTIVYAKPTLSPRVWSQSVGRSVRLDPNNPDKVATIYDLVGCCYTIGRVEDIVLKKEDGFRDMLSGSVGRLDNVPLSKFRIPLSNKEKEQTK